MPRFCEALPLQISFEIMKSRILFILPILVVGILGIALFVPVFSPRPHVYGAYTKPVAVINDVSQSITNDVLVTSVQNVISQKQINPGLPVRLKIPRINVDAPIKSVGVTPQGAMDVPKGPADVAWFNLGPRPGEIGSAVLAGHFGPWKNGKGSVFDNLYKLKKWDKVYIKDGNGITITFIVREIRKYNSDADASDVFSSSDGKAHLNLITCEGVWDKIKKTYSKRLIVFTDKE